MPRVPEMSAAACLQEFALFYTSFVEGKKDPLKDCNGI